MTSLLELSTPALLVDQSVLRDNIVSMQQVANRHGVALRPHLKTHKSHDIARLQLEAGATGVAVAKLGEAEIMADAGIRDIRIANQVVGEGNITRLLNLAMKVEISCAVDSIENATDLSRTFAAAGRVLPVMIEIDTGLHRCGLSEFPPILALAQQIVEMPGLELCGILTHAGHAYAASPSEIPGIGEAEGKAMVSLAEMLYTEGVRITDVSVGSTPTAPHAAAIAGVTEIRPGNYVFHDMMQVSLGTVTTDQCALSVLATVISTPSATRAVIDAGSKALTTDGGAHGTSGVKGFGWIVGTDLRVTRLSEEHGIIEHNGHPFCLGERVRIIPNHACVTVNLFDRMYVCESDQVLAEWPVHARGCSR